MVGADLLSVSPTVVGVGSIDTLRAWLASLVTAILVGSEGCDLGESGLEGSIDGGQFAGERGICGSQVGDGSSISGDVTGKVGVEREVVTTGNNLGKRCCY
jgi:hypothetical protein